MIQKIGRGILGFVLTLVGGVVSAGDRTVHAAITIVSNEFFLMVLTVAALVLLLKA